MAASSENADRSRTDVLLIDPKRVMQMTSRELLRCCKQLDITFDTEFDRGRSQYVEAVLRRLSDFVKFTPAKAPLASELLRVKEKRSRLQKEMLLLIDKLERFLNKSDVKCWLDKLKISESKDWIDQATFKTIREKIVKDVPTKLLVCGCTSAGKSSMLNVLLGEEILPVQRDSMYTTSILCEIYYTEKRDEKAAIVYLRKGSTERAQKLNLYNTKDRSLFQDYILKGRDSSKHMKTGANKEVCFRVEVLLHLDFLKDIVLVDSPGVTATSDLAAKGNLIEYCRHNTHCGVIFVLDPLRSCEEVSQTGGLVQAFVEESDSFAIASSALFVANKWDMVVDDGQEQNFRVGLLQQLAKEWPGFQKHQLLVTISSTLSALFLAVGVVDPDVARLCKGIADILANGVENIILETAKLCLDLLQSISDSVDRTLRIFNMPLAKRDTKRDEDLESLERQQNDYIYGKLGSMAKELQSKIASFSLCLETSYKSGELKKAIKMMAQKQAEHFKRHYTSFHEKFFGYFIVQSLVDAIRNHSEYTELRNWLEKELDVLKACSDVGLRLSDVSTVSTPQATVTHCTPQATDNRCIGSSSQKNVLELVRMQLHVLCTMSPLLIGVSFQIPPLFLAHAEQLFVQLVTAAFNITFPRFLDNNKVKLRMLLTHLLSFEVVSVKLLLDDVPQKLAKEYKHLLDETTHIWNQIADKVIKLDVHTWHKDSLYVTRRSGSGEKSDTTSPLQESFLDARLQPSTLTGSFSESVVVKVVNRRSTSTAEMQKILPVALRNLQPEHNNIIKFHGLALLGSENFTIGLLFEQCVKVQASNEIFSRDGQGPRKLVKVNKMALQLTNAISFLHDRATVFGGFKTDDLRISSNGTIKLVPPPFSKPLWSLTSNLDGPFHNDVIYVAPEVLSHYLYDESADIYSVGIILTEIWNGRRAYDADQTSSIGSVREFKDKVESGSKKTIKSLANKWEDLAVSCWNNEETKRPTAARVDEELTGAFQAAL